MTRVIPAQKIYEQLGLQHAPLLMDVRVAEQFQRVPRLIPGATHLDPTVLLTWIDKVPMRREIALCSATDHDSEVVAQALVARGARVSIIAGGMDRWLDEGLPTIRIRPELGVPGRSQWVTRERPKIDRIACPWLIRRFIDPQATFFYVPAGQVRSEAEALGAQPYDVPDVIFSHRGEHCSFDAFLDEFDLHDPVLNSIAQIIRAADTGTLDLAREAPGLLAISLGLSAAIKDDQLLLEQAMIVYDALYTWCKSAHDESHSWPQKAVRQ